MNWIHISLLLSVFGFLKEFRPSEPFVTDYLTGTWKNFTAAQVNQDIFPVGTYSHLATLVVIFLITDFTRYKPIIILCSLSGSIAFIILIFGKTIFAMIFVEFFYGLLFSTEVAYYTYIYAKVDKKHYQEVTGHTKVAVLLGRFMAGLVAQLTSSFNLLDYHELNYITLAALSFGTVWALFLPSVGQSIYFHPQIPTCVNSSSANCLTRPSLSLSSQHEFQQQPEIKSLSPTLSLVAKTKRAYFLLWKDFLAAYSNSHVLKWSIWWAFATCGYLQVLNYIQLLWQTAVRENEKIYNGAVEAIYTIISAAAVFAISKMPLNWPLIGEGILSMCSFLEGLLLLIASHVPNIWILYASHILFGIIYHTMVTVANFEVAKYISEDSYGLIFGINTLIALVFESILTLVVTNRDLFPEIKTQFTIYGGYFVVLGLTFTVIAIFTVLHYVRSGKKIKIILSNDTENLTELQTDNAVSSECKF